MNREKSVYDMTDEEFAVVKARWWKHLEEKFIEGAVFVLDEDWVGYKKGKRAICVWLDSCKRSLPHLIYEDGQMTTISPDVDRVFSPTWDLMTFEAFGVDPSKTDTKKKRNE